MTEYKSPIQALADYGDQLIRRGTIPRNGWSQCVAGFALEIDEEGTLLRILDLRESVTMGKKMIKRSMSCSLPLRSTHTNSPSSAFVLSDNASYLLGIPKQGEDLGKALAKNKYSVILHHEIFDDVKTEKSIALLRFFDKNKASSTEDEFFAQYQNIWEDIEKTSNLVFLYAEDGTFLHEDPDLIKAWDTYYTTKTYEGNRAVFGQCSITGIDNEPIARIHDSVTGIANAQTSGAALVSFNLPTVDWFGKIQGYSAPVSEQVKENYGAALKYLVKNPSHNKKFGERTLLFWTDSDDVQDNESKTASMAIFGQQKFLYDTDADEALFHTVQAALSGSGKAALEFADKTIDLSHNFYTMLIQPHSARLAIVNFQQNTVEGILQNAMIHAMNCEIDSKNGYFVPNLFQIVEAFKPNGKDIGLSEKEEELLTLSIMNGSKYPHSILTRILNRIRMEGTINLNMPTHAAILKCCLLQGSNENAKRSATTMLNEDNSSIPYNLGRLFALMESLQWTAQGNLNKTISDRFGRAIPTNTAKAISECLRLSDIYIRKLARIPGKAGLAAYYEQNISMLMDKIGTIPRSLSATEQAEFHLGCYHAKAARFNAAQKARQDNTPSGDESEESKPYANSQADFDT